MGRGNEQPRMPQSTQIEHGAVLRGSASPREVAEHPAGEGRVYFSPDGSRGEESSSANTCQRRAGSAPARDST